jgi:RNA polymerase sigma factor (sigma-70 family)
VSAPSAQYYGAADGRDCVSNDTQSGIVRDTYIPHVDPSDEALLAGYATGDPGTAAAFVRRFQGRVYGLALTIVRQPAIAEEVAQETFVRVFRHAGNYDARKGRVSTWLLSIARNLAIDVTRMRRLDPVDPELIAAELSFTSQEPGVDERDLQPDEREQLRSAITELPDDQRRALVLAAYMGRTAREISDLDDVPLGTVKTRIRTAMLKLRDELLVGEE